MSDNYSGTFQVGNLVMWINTCLIFGKEDWVHHLSNVVV